MDKRSLVSVVVDDESVRESLPDLLKVCGFSAQAFASAEEFLYQSPDSTEGGSGTPALAMSWIR